MSYFLTKSEVQKFLDENKLTGGFTVLHEYRDRYLVDDTLSDSDTVLLALFLCEGTGHNTQVYKLESTYIWLGRSKGSWDEALKVAIKNNYVEIYKGDFSGTPPSLPKETHLRLLIGGLKRIEDIFGIASKARHYIIKSGQTFTAKKLFEDFLKAEIEGNEILLCDPYISPSTLYPFSELWGKIDSLKILTANISDEDKFKATLKSLKDETEISTEFKINRKIHDRYLIFGNKCWLIGTSIKDLGNKDCVIKESSEIVQSLTDLFQERWGEYNL